MGDASFPSVTVIWGLSKSERKKPSRWQAAPPIAVVPPPALLAEGGLPPGDPFLPSEWGCEVSNPGFYLAFTIIMSRLNNLPLSPG